MRGAAVIMSSQRGDWETPRDLFEKLDAEFGFTLDAAASAENALCPSFLTEADDALRCSWKTDGAVWLNPPYGMTVGKWVAKALEENRAHGVPVVILLPARTDTKWFHDIVAPHAELRFIRGRLRFGLGGVQSLPAPFPSMLVIFRGRCAACGHKITRRRELLAEVAWSEAA